MFFRKPNRSGPCGAQRCAICPYIIEADSFEDAAGNKITVRNSVDCKSSNLVLAVFVSGPGHTFMSGRPATRSTSADLHTARWPRGGALTLTDTKWQTSAWWGWRSCMAPTTTGGHWSMYGSGSCGHTGINDINTQEWGSIRKWAAEESSGKNVIIVFLFR